MTRRILSDISPLQIEPTRHRGIGQYTAGVLKALLQQPASDISHIFLANGHLPQPCPFPQNTRVDWRLYYGDYPLNDYDVTECLNQLQAYGEYWEAKLERFSPDVLHIHDPFGWSVPLHRRHTGVPTVLTVYDLIPLKLNEHYLQESPLWMRQGYRHVTELIRQADHIVAISEHTRKDIHELLGVDLERISVAYAGPSAIAALTPRRSIADELHRQFNLSGEFILTVSGVDYRKNLGRMLKSYSLLDPELRQRYPFVVVCRLLPAEEEGLRRKTESLGIADQVVFTNYLSDEELAVLYATATVQFFPSIYEGFGMPVLDAMHFGLPVITSPVTSLPEVAGEAAVFVDPFDAADMARALTQVLEDEALRERMRERGLKRARTFCWEDTAQVFYEVYQEICQPRTRLTSLPAWKSRVSNMERLALVSPLPPQRSGIADFSCDLMRALREHLPVTAFVASDVLQRVRGKVEGPVEPITNLPHLFHSGGVDAVLYQVGNNNAFHGFLLPYLVAIPGVIELHDGILHGLVYSSKIRSGSEQNYVHELSYAHGRSGYEHARNVIKGWEPPALYSMAANRRVVNHAAGLIVHNTWTARSAASHGTNLPIEVINHPVTEAETASHFDRQQARRELGLAQETLMLATFGRLERNKRLEVILRVFSQLRDEFSSARLFLVGKLAPSSTDFNIPKLIQDLGIADSVNVTGYVERSRFVTYMAATDIALNLRYPHAGETSGTLVRLLSAGIPTITSNVGAFVEFPDHCCWKVDVDATEERLLLAYLSRLAEDESLRRQMSVNAVTFAERKIPTWKESAPIYLDFIKESLSAQAALLPRVETLDKACDSVYSLGARSSDVPSSRPIWATIRQFFCGESS